MILNWLNEKPTQPWGVTWGVPWKKGHLWSEQSIHLSDTGAKEQCLQTWPMAFWPDGSIKWTGHASVFQNNTDSSFHIYSDDDVKYVKGKIIIEEKENCILINTGGLTCKINKQGMYLIEEISCSSRKATARGKLVGVLETKSEMEGSTTYLHSELNSKIKTVEIEQEGPIRSVVKLEGVLLEKKNSRECFPFVLRMYFYSGLDTIKLVHTFIYDGDPKKDFIKGLGMSFSQSLAGEMWNRNVRFSGDEGIFSESAQLLTTRRFADGSGLFEKQIAGEAVQLDNEKHAQLIEHVQDGATWHDFKIIHDSSDHYKISKRTQKDCSWVDATHGNRAKGLMYVGDKTGGLSIGVKDFWQKHPSSLEISGLGKDETTMTAWFWSPDGETMDLRHYDTNTHVLSAYEGFDEIRATPVGIANTTEMYVKVFSSVPTHNELLDFNNAVTSPPLLICEPEYYYETKSLGVWSLPDRNNSEKAKLEQQLDHAISFYQREIEQRRWYGYWNYGDVMHTYDPVRHQWRYDMGGFAWQNTELVPNIWLWYAFLRSGRHDIFQMAEAMTRHTSEVDCYHLGEYAGLGSRHNVSHWGCGCKEARISMAGLHKYYYFLTADERIRDILEEVRDADWTTKNLDPMREFYPPDEYPTHTRVGPDWSAFVSNWLCEWERTQNLTYKKKIEVGIDNLKSTPYRLLSGPTYGYDPATSKLHHMGDGSVGGYHMIISFGAPQVWMELAELIDDEEWKDMLAEFGEFYLLNDEEKKERTFGKITDQLFSWPMFATGMVAYAASRNNDEELAEKVWSILLDEENVHIPYPFVEQKIINWRTLDEIPTITTNIVSQWCLNTIVALDLIGEHLKDQE
ncbi:hypothetical protein ACERII_11290 [Evansella sp. AB-rgal1]|uniref:exo-rhamnogalacturonan lyase family protein n=1 Tax=Evansella sp. AB-rgal1 TaxID=3242696 RepID=UPI00359D654A